MGGLYDILESYREKDNRLFYDGLYEDPDRFLDYDNSKVDHTNQADYPFTGNIPTNKLARFDARRYNRNQVLPSSYGMNDGTFFNNFNPRIGLENQIPKNLEFLNNQNQADSITELSNSILEDLPSTDPFVGYDMEMNNKLDPKNFQSIFPTSGIMKQAPTQNYQFQTSAYEDQGGDVEQEFLPDQKSSLKDSLSNMGKKFGLSSLIGMVTDNPFLNLLRNNLPEQDPRATGIQDFYSPEGLTSTGSVASGIMQGYNPVSGGFLNMITGGKFGEPTQYGLSGAMQRRIENIIGRRAPQTDSSRSKISELKNLQRQEMQDRSDRGESLGSIGKSTFSGPGMAFEKQNSGTGKGPR